MDDEAECLMTVHLLTHLGHSSPLQQTLDRLLEWLCLDIRLFLVSERVPPLKYYDRYRKRSCSFPGISVLLYLHEDWGEERIFQVHEQFQRPPWRCQRAPCQQDFYGLGEQLPVWGIRRVRCGPEILRVTVYCSFENYEDAVRLYGLILRKEGALPGGALCVFALRAAPRAAVQLCLRQLPVGVAAQPSDSAALQFRVQQIGQLVPLLPNPCVPISSTRWQTRDYEGNTILLKVQSSSRTLETNIGVSQQHSNAGGGRIPQDCVPAPLPVKPGNPGRRSQEVRAVKGRAESDPSAALASEQASSDLQRPVCSPPGVTASRPGRAAAPLCGLRAALPESRRHRGAETDRDTALPAGTAGRCPLSRFPRALRSSLRTLPSSPQPLSSPRALPSSPQPLPSPGTLPSSPQPLPSPRALQSSPQPLPSPRTLQSSPQPLPSPRALQSSPQTLPSPGTLQSSPQPLQSSSQPLPSPRTLQSSPQPLPSPRALPSPGTGTRLPGAAGRRSRAAHGAPQTARASPAHPAEHQDEQEFFI